MEKNRRIVPLRTSSGGAITVEIAAPYGAQPGSASQLKADAIGKLISGLVREFETIEVAGSVKNLTIEFALDAQQDGEALVVFVSRDQLSAPFKVSVELSATTVAVNEPHSP